MRIASVVLILLLVTGFSATPAAALQSLQVSFEGRSYTVVELDLAHDRLELVWRDAADHAYGSIDALRAATAARGRKLLFATNAGMYDKEARPLGLHVEEGRVLRSLNVAQPASGKGNFAIPPNGIFYVDVDSHAGVLPSASWPDAGIKARLATQSGPMLLIDGAVNPRFIVDSDSRKWRSAVCAREPERVTFAVSEVPVSFFSFAEFFRKRIGCRDALYLDGTLTRIYTRERGYAGAPAFLVRPYVGMLAVFESPAPRK